MILDAYFAYTVDKPRATCSQYVRHAKAWAILSWPSSNILGAIQLEGQMENVEFLSRIRFPACRLSGLIRPRLVLWLNIQHIEAHGIGTKFASILPSNLEQRSLKARIVRMGAIIERLQYGPVWLSVRSHGAMKAWRNARPIAGNRNIRLFGGSRGRWRATAGNIRSS